MNSIVVQKYGGTSVGTLNRISRVADHIISRQKEGKQVVVVVSAMAGETDRLFTLAQQVGLSDTREVDALLSTGEQVSASLLALTINRKGTEAISLNGQQVPIVTDDTHGSALIQSVAPQRIRQLVEGGKVVVVTGFQGVTAQGDTATFGRGGSDLTAVALAGALEAERCEIYTDVPGVFTADPSICDDAQRIEKISHDEMLELATLGTKVLQDRAVQMAKRYLIPIWVGSSFAPGLGTWVVEEEEGMEGTAVTAVTCATKDAQISVRQLPQSLETLGKIFSALAEAQIIVDVIVEDRSRDGRTNLAFTVHREDLHKAQELVLSITEKIPDVQVFTKDRVAKVSAVGLGMKTHSGVAGAMFECLAKEGVDIWAVSTSDIKISCVVDEKYAELAVRALHDRFGLAKEPH